MKLVIGKEAEVEVVKSLFLKEYDNNSIGVTDGEWQIITFSVLDGQLVFERTSEIEDINIATDGLGRIVEVDEE